jgi:3-deoxy-D-manno-octulosonic-acid transferase
MSNFHEMSEDFLRRDAAVQVKNSEELGKELIRLFRDPEFRQRVGDRGHAILMANRGAAQRIVSRIESIEVQGSNVEVRTGK